MAKLNFCPACYGSGSMLMGTHRCSTCLGSGRESARSVESHVVTTDPKLGTMRLPAPPFTVVIGGRIVAACTTADAAAAARRLLGTLLPTK